MTPEFLAEAITGYVVLLFSISVHESAHALAAYRLGDDTAARQGRISLNPVVHIDLIGTVVMPLLQFVSGGIPLLAWAKPTPYNPGNFRRGVSLGRGHVEVAAAGPISNVLLALLFTGALFGLARLGSVGTIGMTAFNVLAVAIQLNVVLAVFNLVPVPPLDGSKVVSWGLPRSLGEAYDRVVEPYGQWLLLILLLPISWILSPLVSRVSAFLFRLALQP